MTDNSFTIFRASGTCPSANSSAFPDGSCCFRWSPTANDWEFVSSSCNGNHVCPRGTEGVSVENEHDSDYIRVPCIDPGKS